MWNFISHSWVMIPYTWLFWGKMSISLCLDSSVPNQNTPPQETSVPLTPGTCERHLLLTVISNGLGLNCFKKKKGREEEEEEREKDSGNG